MEEAVETLRPSESFSNLRSTSALRNQINGNLLSNHPYSTAQRHESSTSRSSIGSTDTLNGRTERLLRELDSVNNGVSLSLFSFWASVMLTTYSFRARPSVVDLFHLVHLQLFFTIIHFLLTLIQSLIILSPLSPQFPTTLLHPLPFTPSSRLSSIRIKISLQPTLSTLELLTILLLAILLTDLPLLPTPTTL